MKTAPPAVSREAPARWSMLGRDLTAIVAALDAGEVDRDTAAERVRELCFREAAALEPERRGGKGRPPPVSGGSES